MNSITKTVSAFSLLSTILCAMLFYGTASVVCYTDTSAQTLVVHEPLLKIEHRFVPTFPTLADLSKSLVHNDTYTNLSHPVFDSLSAAILSELNTSASKTLSPKIDKPEEGLPSAAQKEKALSMADAMNDPEVRAKLKTMSPEEQMKFFKNFRSELGVPAAKPSSSAAMQLSSPQIAALRRLQIQADCLGLAAMCAAGQSLLTSYASADSAIAAMNGPHEAVDMEMAKNLSELFQSVKEDKEKYEPTAMKMYTASAQKHREIYVNQITDITTRVAAIQTSIDSMLSSGQSDIEILHYGDSMPAASSIIRGLQSDVYGWSQRLIDLQKHLATVTDKYAYRTEMLQANKSEIYNHFR